MRLDFRAVGFKRVNGSTGKQARLQAGITYPGQENGSKAMRPKEAGIFPAAAEERSSRLLKIFILQGGENDSTWCDVSSFS